MNLRLIWKRLISLAAARPRRRGKVHQVEVGGGGPKIESSLLAHTPPVASQQPGDLNVHASEALIGVEERTQLHGKRDVSGHDDRLPVEGVRKSGTKEPSIATDQYGDGSYDLHIDGRGAQGEAGTLEVAQLLVQRKNQDGEGWSEPQAVNDGSHVDARAKRGRDTLEIQVVRSETSGPFWRDLGLTGKADDSGAIDRAVEGIRTAIQRKGTDKKIAGDRSGVVLVLNALQTPQHSLSLTAEAFRKAYGQWASSLGFKEIWIVGGSSALTHRLDSNQVR